MDDRQIKRPNKTFPKMFRTFTTYIFATLFVFFGYVQIFGDVKPTIITLPTDDAGADEENVFGDFVQSFGRFENIDTDINLSFSNADGTINLELGGNVVYADSGIQLDLDLNYNNQNFDVQASYVNSNLYLTIDENTYKFDTKTVAGETSVGASSAESSSGDEANDEVAEESGLNVSEILNFVLNTLGIDTSFIEDLENTLGFTFDDPNSLLAQLRTDESKQLEDGSYDIRIRLGNLIYVQVLCDSNFNITSARTVNSVLIENNALQFNANVNRMNNVDVATGEENVVEVTYEETGDEIDLSGLGKYVTYVSNLFANNFVSADVTLFLQGNDYAGKLLVDLSDGVKVQLGTEIEGLDVQLTYADEVVFLDANGLKIKFSINDYETWKDKIDALVQTETGKTIEQLLDEFVEKIKQEHVGLEDVDANEILMSILGGFFSNSENVSDFLPSDAVETEEGYKLLWGGATILLSEENGMLKSVEAQYEDVKINSTFAVAESGVEIEDEHYDVTNLLPLVDVVEEILIADQFGGNIAVEIDGHTIDATYVVDFKEDIKARIFSNTFGEDVAIYLSGRNVLIAVGDVVISGSLDNLETFMQKIDEIFGLDIAGQLGDVNVLAFSGIVSTVANILEDVSVLKETMSSSDSDNVLMLVTYLADNYGEISIDGNSAKIKLSAVVDGLAVAGEIEALATYENIFIPTANEKVEDVLSKIENIKNFVESKKYAFDFALSYAENLSISGNIQIDLENNIFDVSGVELFGDILGVRYENGWTYVTYGENKVKVQTENLGSVAKIVEGIINSNLSQEDEAGSDVEVSENEDILTNLLIEIFGEDVTTLSVEEALQRLSINVTGTLNNLVLDITFNSEKQLSASAQLEFVENEIAEVSLQMSDLSATLKIAGFGLTEIAEEEFYNLTSAQKGTLVLMCSYKETLSDGTVQDKELQIVADVEFDLTNKIYLHIFTQILGEDVELVLLNNKLSISIGTLSLGADLKNASEIYSTVVDLFEIALPQGSSGFDLAKLKEILTSLDLSKPIQIDGLEMAISGQQGLLVEYAICDGLNLSFNLKDEQEIELVEIPETAEDVQTILPKIKNVMEYVEKGVFEFDFTAQYNGWNFNGSFKFFDGDIEIQITDVCGESVILRLHEDWIYISYGNMKIKAPITKSGGEAISFADVQSVLDEIMSETFGVKIDFGVFEELLNIIKTYTLSDYFENTTLEISGTTQNIGIKLSNKLKYSSFPIISLGVKFDENNMPQGAEFVIFDGIISGNATINMVENSTLAPFDEEEYASYATNFVDGMLDSLKLENTGSEQEVYAFSSDIAIRYSTNNFYGNLTAMLIETEDGMLFGKYTPAISLHTTSLGLNTFIYLICDDVYVDIHGLQVWANLNEATIDEIMNFVLDNFGQFINPEEAIDESGEVSTLDVGGQVETLEETANAFRVILPALDQIYGSWVSTIMDGMTIDGVQIDIKDDLWYAENSRFYDMVLQVFIENLDSTIIPTKIVLGANIDDPNTTVYEDGYADSLLTCEDAVTSNLNFAVYLNNIVVGKNLEEASLSEIFVSDLAGYQNIVALKSNYGTTQLSDFNSYQTLLETVEATYDYVMQNGGTDSTENPTAQNSLGYQIGIDATISSKTSQTTIGGNVTVQIGDLAEGVESQSGFTLFGNKYLKVYGNNLTVQNQSLEGATETVNNTHIIDLMYESDGTDPAFYLTYTHSNYADDTDLNDNIESGNAFRAKINNSNLSGIISMVLALANVNLGENIMGENGLNLPENTTDFTFLQSLLGIKENDVSDSTSQVDQILSSVENVTKLIKQIKLTESALTISLDLQEDGNIAVVALNFTGSGESKKLQSITIENLAINEISTIDNLTLTIGHFSESNFDYFETNSKDSHIDFSQLSSFVDVAVNTLNTKGLNFNGSTTVSIPLIGDINVGFDVEIKLDANNKLEMYMELDVGSKREVTWTAVKNNDTYTTYNVVLFTEAWSKRISTLEYRNGLLSIVNTTYDSRSSDLSSPKDIVKTYSYTTDQIGENIMLIVTQALGLTNAAYDIIEFAISMMESHPTLERSLLGFSYDENTSTYSLTINAENLTGMSGMNNITLNIGTSQVYKTGLNSGDVKEHKFIDNITTNIGIGDNIITIPLTLNSVSGQEYVTGSGKTLKTNEYYRTEYINTIGKLIV